VGGLLVATIGWFGRGKAARQALGLAGVVAFGFAVAVHVMVGYTDLVHLAPVLVAPVELAAGLVVWRHNEPSARIESRT
jgi:hypothetical protein